jgi:hypothetical protein
MKKTALLKYILIAWLIPGTLDIQVQLLSSP